MSKEQMLKSGNLIFVKLFVNLKAGYGLTRKV